MGANGIPTLKELRPLARKIARVNPTAKDLVKAVLDGGVTGPGALGDMRRAVRYLLPLDTPRKSKELHLELLEFAAEHGTDVRTDEPANLRHEAYFTASEKAAVEQAAKRSKLKVGTFIRRAAVREAQRLLGVVSEDGEG